MTRLEVGIPGTAFASDHRNAHWRLGFAVAISEWSQMYLVGEQSVSFSAAVPLHFVKQPSPSRTKSGRRSRQNSHLHLKTKVSCKRRQFLAQAHVPSIGL